MEKLKEIITKDNNLSFIIIVIVIVIIIIKLLKAMSLKIY